MTIAASRLTVDTSALPWRSAELGLGFAMGTGNNGKPMLMVSPAADSLAEPQHLRFAADVELAVPGGQVIKSPAQLLVTGERLAGMLFNGKVEGIQLSMFQGLLYGFSAGLDDILPVELKKSWRGTQPVAIQSMAGISPALDMQVARVLGSMADSGALTLTPTLADLVSALAPESRASLRQPAADGA
jgi:hypothetical protein